MKGSLVGSLEWRGHSDLPVAIDWSCSMIKVPGIFIGFGDIDAANWNPRIDAVSNCLTSWKMRSLSYSGRAIVANALALSRIWYVASLVHIPSWVLSKLNSLVFKFFWAGKKDLVRRDVVQKKDSGGFSVVSVKFKVQTLLVMWVKRSQESQGDWISLLTNWLFDRFGIDLLTILRTPSMVSLAILPPFYRTVFDAWRSLGGSCDPSSGALTYSGGSNSHFLLSGFTCKLVNLRLLEMNAVVPHCVEKFRPSFDSLYWPATWSRSQLYHMPLD